MRKKDELTKTHTCMQHAHPDEMVFVLLGRDDAAPVAIRAWVAERLRLGKNVESDAQIAEALMCAMTMETEGRQWVNAATHYPAGMGEESRRLHRRYNQLTNASDHGVWNSHDMEQLMEECAAKGIILVPGGENL